MDREIDRATRRRRMAGRIAGGVAVLGGAGVLLALLPGWFSPVLRRERIRLAPVERGRVEETVEASGTLRPASETVLTSPVETRVLRVLRRPGAAVRPGDGILELDTSTSRLELARLEERLAQKQNEQEQVRLGLEKTLADLEARARTAALDVEILDYRVEQRRRLRREGLISEEALREVEVEARKAAIVRAQVEESAAGERRAADARLAGLALDLAILRQEAAEAGRLLALATAAADRAGILTWTIEQEGAAVHRGDEIARIADLGSFRVEGRVSDVHAPRLRAGQPARVVLGELTLEGRVESVDPTMTGGAVTFDVALDRADHPSLRKDLRVDVHVVTEARDGVLKVRRFPYARGGAVQEAFVVRDGLARRCRIRVGLTGYEELEVLEGLQEGDQVIVSDMQDYLHMDEVRVR
jgi:HlyD family secretion protein